MIRNRITEIFIIFKINLLALRNAFIPYLIISIIIPIGFTYIISLASEFLTLKVALNYLVGTLTISLTLSIINGMGQTISEDKGYGRLKLLITLPIKPYSYVLGIFLTFLSAGIINILAVLIIGALLWGILDIVINNLFLVITLSIVSCIGLMGIGALIATRSKNVMEAYMYTNLISIIVAILTPGFYTIDILPSFLRPISLLLPTTYAAILIRGKLLGYAPKIYGLNTIVLEILMFCLTVIYTVIGLLGIKWRED